jgi:hypothetical protein
MKYGLALINRLRLFPHKAGHVDPRFDQRLQRIGAREMRRPTKAGLFRNPRERLAV